MSNLETLINDQRSAEAELRELRDKFRSNSWDRFKQIIPLLFEKYSGLTQLGFRGWTPSFNDGDPCVHSQSLYVDNGDWAEFDEDEYYDAETGEDAVVNKLTRDEAREISRNLQMFEDALEEQYGTNWQLVISRGDNDKLVWTKDYYDCGH